jgi:ketosteroid isomerase-like protein
MTNADIVAAYFVAINAERWDDLASLFDQAVSYRTPGTRVRTGHEDVLAYFRSMFDMWPNHDDRPIHVLVDGDAAAAEVHFTGTTADGRQIDFDAVDIFHFQAERIISLGTWYDLVAVRAALRPATP